MSGFIAGTQSEAERLRASRDAINPLLAEFTKHPKAKWQTLYAELGLALETLLEESSSKATAAGFTPGADALAIGGTLTVAKPTRGDKASPSGQTALWKPDYAKEALKALAASPLGLSPAELGAAVYGSADERGRHKARALIHYLTKKRGVKLLKKPEGGWVLPPAASSEGGEEERMDPPSLVRRVLHAATAPMATGAILEAAMKIDPNVDKKNLYSAVSKLTRNGTLTQTGATSKSKVYSLAGRRRGAAA